MQTEDKHPLFIPKDLEAEANIKDHVAYFPMAGQSQIDNFRSPDSYVLLFFEESEGWHSIDFVRHEQKNYQIHISFPGQIHSWNSAACTRGHKLIISRYFVERYMFEASFISSKVNKYPVIDISKDAFSRLTSDLSYISEDLTIEEIKWSSVLLRAQLIVLMVNYLIAENVTLISQATKYNPLFHQFKDLIDQHFTAERSVAFYAAKLHISPNYLNIIAKQFNDLSAKGIIDQRTVLEAKRLLLGSTLTIKEIMDNLGFEEMSHFSIYIKSKTGFTPSELRKGVLDG